jgi:hypothetical protein
MDLDASARGYSHKLIIEAAERSLRRAADRLHRPASGGGHNTGAAFIEQIRIVGDRLPLYRVAPTIAQLPPKMQNR